MRLNDEIVGGLRQKVKAIYIYQLKHRVDKWSASITHHDGFRKGAIFYTEEDALSWVYDYLETLETSG